MKLRNIEHAYPEQKPRCSKPAYHTRAPELFILSYGVCDQTFVITFASYRNSTILKQTATAISSDREQLKKFSAEDAHRIGYMAGIYATVRDYELMHINQSDVLKSHQNIL